MIARNLKKSHLRWGSIFLMLLLCGCDSQISSFVGIRSQFSSDDRNLSPENPISGGPTTPPVSALKNVKSISASAHSCAIHDDGMDCWGSNYSGQLGVAGTPTISRTPVASITSKLVQDVGTGDSHTCAVVDSGLKCVGSGSVGQLGTGGTSDSTSFVDVYPSGSQITDVSVGGSSTCAVKSGGLFCWGQNLNGKLGDGTTTNRLSPVQIFAPGSGVTKVAIGFYHTCAIVNGEVWCWGLNSSGSVGDGTTTSRFSPVKITALGSGVSDIAVGDRHTCAIKNGGLSCWGLNNTGQIGDNSLVNRSSPVSVFAASSGVTEVSLGSGHSCAIVNDDVKCWGSNNYGQLNNLLVGASQLTPTTIFGASLKPKHIASGSSYVCVSLKNTKIICWGGVSSGAGEVGGSLTWTTPEQVQGMTANVSQLAKIDFLFDDSTFFNCVVQDGGVKCWGVNGTSGALGNGSTATSNIPVVAIPASSGAVDVSIISGTTNASACAVVNGGVRCWGAGYATTPMVVIADSSGATEVQLTQYDSFAKDYGCAVVNGGVHCWGANSFGQLGNGTTTESPTTPVTAIASGSGATDVELRQGSSCAIVSGGLRCWGLNNAGQLGDGSTTTRTSPVTIFANGSNVTDIAIVGDWHSAGNATTCAVVNGGLQCWGYNANGLVGDGTTTQRNSPVQIFSAGSGVTQVFGSYEWMCAIKNSGLYCWGANYSGGLGVGDLLSKTTPTLVLAEGSGVTAAALQFNSGCAVVNGGLMCWGENSSGSVGDGTVTQRLSPVWVIPAGSNVQDTQIVFYGEVSCALVSSGVKCWGSDGNYAGLIGNGKVSRGEFSIIGYEN